MSTVSKTLLWLAASCMCLSAYAQYDDSYSVEEWSLDLDEEEAAGPQHKEYKNALYVQYSPARYMTGDDSRMLFNEYVVGYNRIIQIVEEKPYFIEAGAAAKFSWARGGDDAFALTFRVPINVFYKFYLSREKDYAIAPFAGASLRAIAVARDDSGSGDKDFFGEAGWDHFQVAWQTGVRFYLGSYYMGVSYSRDFRDQSKYPGVRECGLHVGYCF